MRVGSRRSEVQVRAQTCASGAHCVEPFLQCVVLLRYEQITFCCMGMSMSTVVQMVPITKSQCGRRTGISTDDV